MYRGNYSFLNLALCTVTNWRKLFKGGNTVVGFLISFFRLFSLQFITIHVLLDKLTRKKINKYVYVITSQSYKIKLEKSFFTDLPGFGRYTVFIKSIGSTLQKSKRMIIDWQLNRLLEDCLKTQLMYAHHYNLQFVYFLPQF